MMLFLSIFFLAVDVKAFPVSCSMSSVNGVNTYMVNGQTVSKSTYDASCGGGGVAPTVPPTTTPLVGSPTSVGTSVSCSMSSVNGVAVYMVNGQTVSKSTYDASCGGGVAPTFPPTTTPLVGSPTSAGTSVSCSMSSVNGVAVYVVNGQTVSKSIYDASCGGVATRPPTTTTVGAPTSAGTSVSCSMSSVNGVATYMLNGQTVSKSTYDASCGGGLYGGAPTAARPPTTTTVGSPPLSCSMSSINGVATYMVNGQTVSKRIYDSSCSESQTNGDSSTRGAGTALLGCLLAYSVLVWS